MGWEGTYWPALYWPALPANRTSSANAIERRGTNKHTIAREDTACASFSRRPVVLSLALVANISGKAIGCVSLAGTPAASSLALAGWSESGCAIGYSRSVEEQDTTLYSIHIPNTCVYRRVYNLYRNVTLAKAHTRVKDYTYCSC